MQTPVILTDSARIAEFCASLRKAGRFAFDTEFIRDDTYDAILCLVQVAGPDGVTLIDPGNGAELTPFWNLLLDPSLLKIVHAGKEDFDVCLRATGRPPRNVFDVQIAAGFVGFGYPLSLVRLVDQVLGKRVAKGQTLTDWLRRPLTPDQLRYAVDDVAHLPAAYERLAAALQDRQRERWATEEFHRFEDAAFYKQPVEDRVYKVKGARRLDGLGLAILARLLEWRDEWARERNRPARVMVRDDVLVELARRRPTSPGDVEIVRGFPQSRGGHAAEQALAVIHAAMKTPRAEWPAPVETREDSPMMKATVDLLSAVTRALCHENGVAHDLVGIGQKLRDLVAFLEDGRPDSDDARPSLLRGWRRTFVGDYLVALLEGRSELHFSGWPKNPRLDIISQRPATGPHPVTASSPAAPESGR